MLRATTSDASGRFTLRGVEPGQYRISVRRNGYVATDQAGSRAISPGATLTLATSQTVKNVLAKLIPHAVVTGRVTDLDGEPLASANVQLMRFKYSQQGQRQLVPFNAAQTNDLGEYRLFGVPPGKYFVGVAPPGRMAYWGAHDGTSDQDAGAEGPVGTYYPGTADPTQATGIDVRMGGTLQGIDVRVLRSRTFRVSGQVMGAPSGGRQGMVMLEPTGAGAASVSQMMRGPMGAPWRQDGKFTVRGVPPGSYSIIVESFENEARLRGTAEVEVGDRNVDNAQVLLQPSFDVTGAVDAHFTASSLPVVQGSARVRTPESTRNAASTALSFMGFVAPLVRFDGCAPRATADTVRRAANVDAARRTTRV